MTDAETFDHLAYAASHVDVLKHTAWRALLSAMQFQHTDGITVVDAFCGRGAYDLGEQESGEYEKGILRVHDKIEGAPKPVQHYYQIVKGFDTYFQNYPGSPVITDRMMRKQDEHRLVDLYEETVEGLRGDNWEFVQDDAFDPEALDFLVPDNGKHPVILIDPSYADGEDFYRAKCLMEAILKKRKDATVMISFPLIHGSRYRWGYLKGLKEDSKKLVKTGYYACSMTVHQTGIQGNGVFIANAPKNFDEVGMDEETVNWLSATMVKSGRSDFSLDHWVKKLKPKT